MLYLLLLFIDVTRPPASISFTWARLLGVFCLMRRLPRHPIIDVDIGHVHRWADASQVDEDVVLIVTRMRDRKVATVAFSARCVWDASELHRPLADVEAEEIGAVLTAVYLQAVAAANIAMNHLANTMFALDGFNYGFVGVYVAGPENVHLITGCEMLTRRGNSCLSTSSRTFDVAAYITHQVVGGAFKMGEE